MTGSGDPRDDRALLAAHLAGDPDAFGELFGRHRDRLWAVALRTTADREEAADALQDALVAAFRRADSYRGDAAVTTWLHRIVVNACLDRLRRGQVRRADPLPEDLDRLQSHPGTALLARGDAAGDPAVTAERRDIARAVHRALAALPVDQRDALVLVDLEGRSMQEASEILGVAVGTVKSRCSRGRARLLPLLRDLQEGASPPSDVRHRNRNAPARVLSPEPNATATDDSTSDSQGGDAR